MKPGDRVICIDDRGTAPNFNAVDPNYPAFEIVEGNEYVVAWAGKHCDPFYEGTYDGLRLVGIRRPVDPVSGVEDKPFAARRFRPLVSNPMQFLRELAKDPDLPVQGEEGPVRGEPLPDDGEGEKREREVEVVE